MALSAESMAKDIMDAMEEEEPDTAEDANKVLGDAILKHICENISLTYVWAAVGPAPASLPDPQAMFEAAVSGSGDLTPSATFPEMLEKLAALIKGLIIQAPEGFLVAPLAFNPLGVIIAVMAGEDTQKDAMESLCAQIIGSMILSFINPVPAAGTHGIFSGATTAMIIL